MQQRIGGMTYHQSSVTSIDDDAIDVCLKNHNFFQWPQILISNIRNESSEKTLSTHA